MILRIKLLSFEKKHLILLCQKIIQKGFLFSFKIKGPIFLPTKKTLFTVLKSPHVNKQAREQFKLVIYKCILILDFTFLKNSFFQEEIKIFLNYLKNLSGTVQVKIEYIS